MAVVSSGVNLSSDFYMSSFYKTNRSFRKESARKEVSSSELSYADAVALRRAVKKLGSFDYSDEDQKTNIANAITAFASTYNNALEASSSNSSSDVSKYAKQLKKVMSKYSDELEDIGITMESDGKLSVNTSLLKSADLDKMEKVFSSDNTDILSTTKRISNGLKNNSYNAIYTELTGNGGTIDINI